MMGMETKKDECKGFKEKSICTPSISNKQLAEGARKVGNLTKYKSWLKSQGEKSDALANSKETRNLDPEKVTRGECSGTGGKNFDKSSAGVEHENLVEQSLSHSSRSNKNDMHDGRGTDRHKDRHNDIQNDRQKDRHKDKGHVPAGAECIVKTLSVASREGNHTAQVAADSHPKSSKFVTDGTNLGRLIMRHSENASAEVDHEGSVEQSLYHSSHSYQNDMHTEKGNVYADAKSQPESTKFVVNGAKLVRDYVDPSMGMKRKPVEVESDANVGTTDGCFIQDDRQILLLSPKTRSPCLKKIKLDQNSVMREDCFQNAKPDQELNCTSSSKDRGEIEDGLTTGIKEINDEMVHQDEPEQCNTDSSTYEEYWVPVHISDVQLEQYCESLVSNSPSLCSASKADPFGCLCKTLISVRKSCNHPYVVDQYLPSMLRKDVKEIDYLDVDIKASGKVQLLEAMLTEARKNGLKIVVVFQTTGGAGRDSTADILDDLVRQRFGPGSYDAIRRDHISSKKQSAVNRFNKESERFVLLLEMPACSPSIKLSMVGAFIIFDSSWSPLNDLRALQKIKIEPGLNKIKIFRLYSFCTVEEKVLLLARENKCADCSTAQDISPAITHQLLMWGAHYLFHKLEVFHKNQNSRTSLSYEPSILEGVVGEISAILTQNHNVKCKTKLSLVLEARHSQETYSTKFALFGEEKVKLFDEDTPDIFWTKLLKEKNPKWIYISASTKRNRKGVQYLNHSANSHLVDNDEVAKKRKKIVAHGVDPDETAMIRKDREEVVGSPPVDDEQRKMCESQKGLRALLKPSIAKLYEVLHLSDEARRMADKFLEYVKDNHNVSTEPETTLQAFQIAVCWVAASLLKLDISLKQSLVLAKLQLGFGCTQDEVDYHYSILYCLKSIFLARTRALQLDSHPKDSEGLAEINGKNHSGSKLSRAMVHQKTKSMNLENQLYVQECSMNQGVVSFGSACELQLAKRDFSESVKDIRKKCQMDLKQLVEEHLEEKAEFERQYEEEKKQLEKDNKVEAALIRLSSNVHIRASKLKKLKAEYAIKFEELKCKQDERLNNLEVMHEAARNHVTQKEAFWIEKVQSWAKAELFNPSSSKHDLRLSCSEAISSKTSEGDVIEAYNNSVQTDGDQENTLVEDSSLKEPNPIKTALDGDKRTPDGDGDMNISKIVVFDTVQENILPAVSSSPREAGLFNSSSSKHDLGLPCSIAISSKPSGSDVIVVTKNSAQTDGDRENKLVEDSSVPETQNTTVPALNEDRPTSDGYDNLNISENVAFDTVQGEPAALSSPEHGHDGSAESIRNNEQMPSTEPELAAVVASNTCQEDILPFESSLQERGHDGSADGRPNGEVPSSTEHELTTFSERVNMAGSVSSLAGDKVLGGVEPPEHDEDISLNVADVTESSVGLDNATSVTPIVYEEQVTASATSVMPEALHTNAAGSPLPAGDIDRTGNEDETCCATLMVNQQHSESVILNEETLMEVMDQSEVALVQPLSACSSLVSNPAVHGTCSAAMEDELVCIGNAQADECQTGVDRRTVIMQTLSISPGTVPEMIRLPYPMHNDPVKNELERLRKETADLATIHEEAKLKMKAEFERGIAEFHRKYQIKQQEAENEFMAKKKELETKQSYVLKHKNLADGARSKFCEPSTPVAPVFHSTSGPRSDAGSGFGQQQVQSSFQNGTQWPQLVVIPSLVVSPVLPNQQNGVLVPQPMASQQLNHRLNSLPEPRRPTSTFTGTTHLGGRLRTPPHLQHRSRPPLAPASANADHAFRPRWIQNQRLPMAPSPIYHQPAIYSRLETTGGATHVSNPILASADLFLNVSNSIGVNPNANLSSPVNSSDMAAQLQHGLQNVWPANSVAAGETADVVCLSDDDG